MYGLTAEEIKIYGGKRIFCLTTFCYLKLKGKPMIKSEAAIDKAVAFLKKLKPEYLGSGSAPDNIRLETIQLSGKEWYVLLRYTISIPRTNENIANQLLEALSTRNYFKEFENRCRERRGHSYEKSTDTSYRKYTSGCVI